MTVCGETRRGKREENKLRRYYETRYTRDGIYEKGETREIGFVYLHIHIFVTEIRRAIQ